MRRPRHEGCSRPPGLRRPCERGPSSETRRCVLIDLRQPDPLPGSGRESCRLAAVTVVTFAVGLWLVFFRAPPTISGARRSKIVIHHVPFAWLSMF